MNIELFQGVTTEIAIQKLEAEGLKLSGLYLDLNDKDQRKYAKDQAALIGGLLKKVDRVRIDKSKEFKAAVEKEAKAIRERLETANLPFTQLIGAYNHERAEILAAEKAKADAMALALQVEADHDHAILMDKVQTNEALEKELHREADRQRIASEAAEKAVQQEKQRHEYEAQALEVSRLQREADKVHVSDVLRKAKDCLMAYGMSEDMAKTIVIAIHKGDISNVSISY